MRLATIVTPSGPRLHVAAAGGYVDVAAASGDPALAALGSVLAAGDSALATIGPLTGREGIEFGPADSARPCPSPRASCASG